MGQTILYGVDSTNKIHEIHHQNNGMASCLPIWNYLDNKYFPNENISFSERPCWKLTPQTLSNEEYFMLLASFDGYYFTKDHLSEMIELLKLTHIRQVEPVKSTRLEIFEIAFKNNEYDKFFITATTVGDYEYFIKYHDDENLDEYTSEPTLRDTVWDIWEEFVKDTKNKKVAQPDCNLYFWGMTESDCINTLKALYKMNPAQLAGRGISCEEDVVDYAKKLYHLLDKWYCYRGFEIFPPDLIGQIGNLEFRLEKEGDCSINVWNEEKQQFDTVSLKELIESKKLENITNFSKGE